MLKVPPSSRFHSDTRRSTTALAKKPYFWRGTTFNSLRWCCWLASLFLVPVLLGDLGLFDIGVLAQDSELGPPSTNPECTNPPMDQCAFYADCLDSRYHCGPDGYPIGYGQYYCQKFSDNSDLFDTRGQQWIIDTMYCLQLALVGDAVDVNPPAGTCEALSSQAFASHPGCYVSTGFCTLGVQDWAAVLKIVGVTMLISTWDSFNATAGTAAGCGEFYLFLVEEGLLP